MSIFARFNVLEDMKLNITNAASWRNEFTHARLPSYQRRGVYGRI